MFLGLLCLATAASANTADNATILVVGDSLSAAYQMDPAQGWVSLLAGRLSENGLSYRVINASISGDTSHGGLSRLPTSLQKYHPQIVILELGANDGLRGLPLQELRHNLAQMIQLSQAAGARVLLLGMQLPPNYGPAYTRGFRDIFSSLAREYDTGLLPFFLAGVATTRSLIQADNLHPRAEAQPLLLDNVWPHLLPLIKNR